MEKKREKREPPVPISLDERGRERSRGEGTDPETKAPDGISGDWG